MALIVVTFVSILLTTFLLIMVTMRQTEEEKIVGQRMAMLRQSLRTSEGMAFGAEQLLKKKKKSRLDWLNEFLCRFRLGKALEEHILQADSSTTVGGLLLKSMSLWIAGYCITWLFAPMILIDAFAGLALSLVPYGILSLKRRRRINAFNAALPEAIDILARALRAGHSVVGALEMLAENAQKPASQEFAEVFKQLNLGLPMRNALLQLLERMPSADLRVLVTAIMVQKDTGGNLVEILDRTVFVIRERLRVQGEIQVQTAQGRLTGWILTALPVVMLLLLNLVNPGYSSILFHEPVGRKLIYISLAMLGIGGGIIRQIVNGIEV
jgi:tight adherence protein B